MALVAETPLGTVVARGPGPCRRRCARWAAIFALRCSARRATRCSRAGMVSALFMPQPAFHPRHPRTRSHEMPPPATARRRALSWFDSSFPAAAVLPPCSALHTPTRWPDSRSPDTSPGPQRSPAIPADSPSVCSSATTSNRTDPSCRREQVTDRPGFVHGPHIAATGTGRRVPVGRFSGNRTSPWASSRPRSLRQASSLYVPAAVYQPR